MSIIEVDNLRKQFDPPKGVVAVDHLNFHIDAGEIYSLLGPNGAGKTTTISVLSCLLKPTAGDARVDGHSVTTGAARVKEAIGVVPQEIALYPDMSARENLAFWGRMYGMGGAELSQRVEEVLELVGLADRAKERLEKFSGGMKRRVNIGAALLHKPRILYLDEPTVGIDPQSRRAILDGVLELNREGMTVLYTTHYMEEAQEISNRIGIMDHGRMIAEGTHEQLVQSVGEETRIELAVDHGAQQMLDLWCSVDGVTASDTEDDHIRLLARNATAVVPRLFETAGAAGVTITEITVAEPNLEMVFLHLTGRALRD